jgi:hypothetical protein
MTPEAMLKNIIDPGIKLLNSVGGPPSSDAARVFLLCITAQEVGSTLTARYQNAPSSSPGPARGFWQFEQGGGVHGIFTHKSTSELVRRLCEVCSVAPNEPAIWRALEGHDLLAAACARALLFTDPYAVPTEKDPAWVCYAERLWRPGKPHPETWAPNWTMAKETVKKFPILVQGLMVPS